MKVKREQIPYTIRFLQIDFPALVLQTGGIEDNDEYWKQVVEQVDIISKKYNGNGFVDHMVLAYTDYLEKMYRKAKAVSGKEADNEQH